MKIYPNDILVALRGAVAASEGEDLVFQDVYGFPNDAPSADIEIELLSGWTVQIDGTLDLSVFAHRLSEAIARREH